MKKLVFVVLAAMLAGCSTMNVVKESYSRGSVLILPARDVVQGGAPHPVGAGSGQYFAQAVSRALDAEGRLTSLMTGKSNRFMAVPTREEAITQAKSAGADYVLVTVLGEFLDAAPFTFREDYVTLQKAVMYSVKDGKLVFSLEKPYRASGTNLGNYYRLMDEIAAELAKQLAV